MATTAPRRSRPAPLLNRATLRHSDADIEEAVAAAMAAKERDLLVAGLHQSVVDLTLRADNANHLSAKVDTRATAIEVKVDALSDDIKTLAATVDKVADLVDSHETFLQSSGVTVFMHRLGAIERFTTGVRGFVIKTAAAAVGIAAVIEVVNEIAMAVHHLVP